MRLENWDPSLASDAITKESMDRLEKAGELVASRARAKVPVGKGRAQYKGSKDYTAREVGALRDSIRVVRLKDDPKLNIRVYVGSRKVFYAGFVEYGTLKMRAKPFMRPALNESKEDILQIVEIG